MKSKHIFMVLLLVLAAPVMFAGCQSVETTEVVEPTAVEAGATFEPTEETVQRDLSDPAALLESMMKQYEESVFTQSGWMHYSYDQESDLENGVVFPDDSLFPKDYVVDGWFHFDEDGTIFEDIITYGDGEGIIYQGSAYTNHVTVSWPWYSRYNDTNPEVLHFSLGILQMLLSSHTHFPLAVEEIILDEQSILRFTSEQPQDEPVFISGSSQPVQQTNVIALLDAETGALIESKTIFILEDGTQEITQRVYNFTLEWTELPEDKAQLLLDVQNDTFPEELILTPPPVTRENILERLAKFNKRGAEKHLTPGWVRVLEDRFVFIDDETGEPAPDMVEVETYYLMGDEGEVLQYISLGDDDIIVYQDKVFTNLLNPEDGSTEPEDFYLTGLDFGLAEYIQNHPNLELDMLEENMGLVTIVVTEMYETETTFENGVTVVGLVSSYQLDIADGTVMLVEQSYIPPDGSNLTKANIIIEAIEKIDVPPDYILEYFE